MHKVIKFKHQVSVQLLIHAPITSSLAASIVRVLLFTSVRFIRAPLAHLYLYIALSISDFISYKWGHSLYIIMPLHFA